MLYGSTGHTISLASQCYAHWRLRKDSAIDFTRENSQNVIKVFAGPCKCNRIDRSPLLYEPRLADDRKD